MANRSAPADPLSMTFTALADPTRRAILARLAQGEATVTELAEPFALSLPGVSKHLKVLQRAGLVTQGRRAQWRPCRLDVTPLQDVDTWLERYRRGWEERLERLDEYLKDVGPVAPSAAGGPGHDAGAGPVARMRAENITE